MAAPTINRIDSITPGKVLTLETWAHTNLASGGGFIKALPTPVWATDAIFYMQNTAVAGTSGLVDFKLEVVNPVSFDVATGVTPLGDWDGITQVTNTTNQLITIEVGPDTTADDTGSATASCRYGVRAILPQWILYTIAFDSTTDDEDYTGHLAVEYRKR